MTTDATTPDPTDTRRVVAIDLYRDPDPCSAWGPGGPDDTLYDTEASEARLEDLITAALRAEYPDAAIEWHDGDGMRDDDVTLYIPDIGRVVDGGSNEAAAVRDTIARVVWDDDSWVVERTTAARRWIDRWIEAGDDE